MDTTDKRRKKGTFTKFLATFDYNHTHIKVRQMKQKVLKQLEYAAIGRPFKTAVHLTYQAVSNQVCAGISACGARHQYLG